jgi:hypothetical protein
MLKSNMIPGIHLIFLIHCTYILFVNPLLAFINPLLCEYYIELSTLCCLICAYIR